MKEIAPKNASADFKNFCRLASKKGGESAGFFRLRGNTVDNVFNEYLCGVSCFSARNSATSCSNSFVIQ